MRFLMVCMQFPMGPGQSYMTTELADALLDAGHQIEVLFLDWSVPSGDEIEVRATARGIRVVRFTPRAIGRRGSTLWKATKFLLTGRQVAKVARRHFDLTQFDAVVAWMPAIAIAPLIPLLIRAGIRRRILFIWDFFPDHHREIDRIPAGLPFGVARIWERRLVRRFTAIICTQPGNAAYLRSHYPIRPEQRVLVTPIWSDTTPLAEVDRDAARSRHGLPLDRPIAVFGGQLVEGRGFEQMLGAAKVGRAAHSRLLYLFVGDGRFASLLREQAAGHRNIAHRGAMPRQDYLQLIAACDVGIVATVPGVTSYSIPTKTIDYLRAGLPVVAAIEPGNELLEVLHRFGIGEGVQFGDEAAFHATAERLATNLQTQSTAKKGARNCLDQVFDVRHAVATLEAAVRP